MTASVGFVRLGARFVLVPRERQFFRDCTLPNHEAVLRRGGVRSLCGEISMAEARRAWTLAGTDFNDAQPVTCQRCVLTGKVCRHCGQPITRRQSYMSLPEGGWQHLRACW